MDGLKRVQANLKRYRATVLKAACEGKLVPTEAELCQGDLAAKERKERKKKYKEPAAPDVAEAGDPPFFVLLEPLCLFGFPQVGPVGEEFFVAAVGL